MSGSPNKKAIREFSYRLQQGGDGPILFGRRPLFGLKDSVLNTGIDFNLL